MEFMEMMELMELMRVSELMLSELMVFSHMMMIDVLYRIWCTLICTSMYMSVSQDGACTQWSQWSF